jgi:hypothetical protein
MNRLEVQKILASLDLTYSNFKVEDNKKTLMVDTWHKLLEKYDYADVSAALMEYIGTSNSAYAPSVSQLIGIVKSHKTIPVKLSLMNSAEAWEMVRKAMQNSAYNCVVEFEKLPKLIQKAVGSANQLQVWATDEDYNEGVISSVFKRNYEEVCSKETQYTKLTPQQKAGVDQLKDRLNRGEELRDIVSGVVDHVSLIDSPS